MKAIVITQYGTPEALQLQDKPDPAIRPDEVLIDVKAAGVNRPDIFQRKGNYSAPPGVVPDIPGLEVSGIIRECGSDVKKWKIGDRVCALIAGGGYAEKVVVCADHCLPVPASLSFVEAASLPETVYTVWDNVFRRGGLKEGEHFLVHGGSSGIGVTSIQLAKSIGAKVYATAGSDEKCKACLDLGANVCINYNVYDFDKVFAEEKIDVILDMVGGPYFQKNMSIMNEDGRLVYINAMKGSSVELNIGEMMRKRINITGSTLRSRDKRFKTALTEEVLINVWPKIDSGHFKPVIFKEFLLKDAWQAHKLMEDGNHIGKIVLRTE
ncbi:NAD(P)H-quinone oxidoreductase [Olivibacter sp. XZL3]|uniref:NAD(P)H-quinone oxidoreductase n=1 Tax=Olivibacter sp. XZL3 TaxID=1735116 RepID=UPI001064A14E|nr:NAD(P)H-quinone oxidoreductase [Olivibacter sp. XZL3]